ncbi:MAG: molybdopterin-dependent oxidoreductase [candidate division Zixibacteria bacterium]|nr:molybdopterin-dependent oxidoreductase [candidate division Zixibacteria bacterium]
MNQAAGCYRIPNVRITATHVYTNQGPCGHMRAPGEPQVGFAVESHTDMIARRLGIDPVEFRQRNMMRDGDEGPLGKIWKSVAAGEVVARAAAGLGWSKPKQKDSGRGLAVSERPTGIFISPLSCLRWPQIIPVYTRFSSRSFSCRCSSRWTASVFATTSRPVVFLSRRWTIPALSRPYRSLSARPRPKSACTSVPLRDPTAG